MVLVHMESLAPRAVKMTRERPAGALSTKDSLMGNISRQPLNGSRSAVPCRIIDGAAISSVPRFEVRQPRPRESYSTKVRGSFKTIHAAIRSPGWTVLSFRHARNGREERRLTQSRG